MPETEGKPGQKKEIKATEKDMGNLTLESLMQQKRRGNLEIRSMFCRFQV